MTKPNDWKKRGDFFEFQGHKIFFRADDTSKPALLCLHGFPSSSFDYHKIWNDLNEHFSVYACDLIGYGFSDKPRDFSYTTVDQANLVTEFVKYLELKEIHLLTHDYGNTITQELLARRQEKQLDFEIKSLCFMNGALFPETHRPILAQKILISPIGAIFGRLIPEHKFRSALASVFGPHTQPSTEELDDFMELFNNKGGRRISHLLIRYMRERSIHRERWVGALATIDFPFRFINGLADPVSGRHLVARFRELFPDFTDIVELEDIGHFPHFEKPTAVIDSFFDFHRIPGQ